MSIYFFIPCKLTNLRTFFVEINHKLLTFWFEFLDINNTIKEVKSFNIQNYEKIQLFMFNLFSVKMKKKVTSVGPLSNGRGFWTKWMKKKVLHNFHIEYWFSSKKLWLYNVSFNIEWEMLFFFGFLRVSFLPWVKQWKKNLFSA